MRTILASDGLLTIPLGEDPVLVEAAEDERTYLALVWNATAPTSTSAPAAKVVL